jgi:hypothetical protein
MGLKKWASLWHVLKTGGKGRAAFIYTQFFLYNDKRIEIPDRYDFQ